MLSRIKNAFSDIFAVPESEISPELTQDDVELWDSLNHLQLVTALEQEFGIKLSMAEIEYINSVARVIEVVERHRPKG